MLWERGCTPDRAAGPTVAAFGHRQRRCDDMLAAVSQDSANYCQASARRDMIMGARMCAQGTSGLLRDAWLGSASACEFSMIFFVLIALAGVRTTKLPRTTWTREKKPTVTGFRNDRIMASPQSLGYTGKRDNMLVPDNRLRRVAIERRSSSLHHL